MTVFEIEYEDAHGHHAEAIEGWDREDAIHHWRAQHSGQRVVLLDVSPVGDAEEALA